MAPLNYTVLGAGGFIGGALREYLALQGHHVHAPPRTPPDELMRELGNVELGHVVYCIGLTADFRTRPFATIEAHVTLLSRILESCSFASFVYLSSTRVYGGAEQTYEKTPLRVQPLLGSDLYNLSKLLGESLCVSSGKPCKIARLSNVFGAGSGTDNFIGAVVDEAVKTGNVRFQSSPSSEKDFIGLDDVVRWLAALGPHGSQTIYNLASGRNTTNRDLARALETAGIATEFVANAPLVTFPRNDTRVIDVEFGAASTTVESQLPKLIETARVSH